MVRNSMIQVCNLENKERSKLLGIADHLIKLSLSVPISLSEQIANKPSILKTTI